MPSWRRSRPGESAASASPPKSMSKERRSPTTTSPACSPPVSRSSARQGRVLLHALPIGFSLDGTPRGARTARDAGPPLRSSTCTLRPPISAACRNLMLVIERCHLDVEAMVAGAYASGLSTLADDEADVGAAVVDFGAGTTTLSVFGNGRFVHADGFALGGNHVTMDLGARTFDQRLQTPSESRRSTAVCWPAARTIATDRASRASRERGSAAFVSRAR